MRILVMLLVALLASSVGAWEITTKGPVTIRGDGDLPALTPPTPAPPVVTPPPLPPPPVVPPVVDTSPFPFPAQQPPQEMSGEARYFDLCGLFGGCYAGLPSYNNPLRQSHRFACITPMGMLYRNNQSIGGFRLYVPIDLAPNRIRTLCAGGAL